MNDGVPTSSSTDEIDVRRGSPLFVKDIHSPAVSGCGLSVVQMFLSCSRFILHWYGHELRGPEPGKTVLDSCLHLYSHSSNSSHTSGKGNGRVKYSATSQIVQFSVLHLGTHFHQFHSPAGKHDGHKICFHYRCR